MEALFLKLFNMSVSAGWIVLAILLFRLIVRKSAKWVNVVLWVLVAVRLCLPFSIKSMLSLIPSTNTIPQEITVAESPVIESGFEAVDSAVNPIITENLAPSVTESVNPIAIILSVAVAVWLIGIAVMLTYMVISYLRIYFRIREGVPDGDNTMLCDRINTPFVMGIIRPKIYLPSSMDEAYKPYVIAHENVHIKRRDYLWKLLAFVFLTVYWFNPLVWVAYIIFSRDIEFACDEKVIKKYGEEYKAAYSTALLNCSIKKKPININPLAFGEVSVKNRIKNILKYKKPSLWITVISVVLIIALGVFFLTDPLDKKKADKAEKKEETSEITETVTYEIIEDTTSEPDETVTNNPSENTSQQTEPQNTETLKPQETVSTPTNAVKAKPAKVPNYSGGNTDEFFNSLPELTEKEKEEILAKRGMIDKEIEFEVKQAYVSSWLENKADLTTSDVSVIKYYGTYNGAVVVKMYGAPIVYSTAIRIHEVEGIIFLYSDANYTVVYKNNAFYNLQEAYDEGILNIEDLKKIQEINMVIY